VKVVLSEHVDHLGDRGEIVTVAAGYARNYLIPKRLALKATPGNMRMLEQERRVWKVREARAVEEAQAMAARMGELDLSVTKKAGEKGTLYGSVTNMEIAELFKAQGVEIDRRRIVLAEPVKRLGDHAISIRLHRDVIARVTLQVVSEQGDQSEVSEPSEPSEKSEFADLDDEY